MFSKRKHQLGCITVHITWLFSHLFTMVDFIMPLYVLKLVLDTNRAIKPLSADVYSNFTCFFTCLHLLLMPYLCIVRLLSIAS